MKFVHRTFVQLIGGVSNLASSKITFPLNRPLEEQAAPSEG